MLTSQVLKPVYRGEGETGIPFSYHYPGTWIIFYYKNEEKNLKVYNENKPGKENHQNAFF